MATRCGRKHPFPINLFPSLLCSACRARNSGGKPTAV